MRTTRPVRVAAFPDLKPVLAEISRRAGIEALQPVILAEQPLQQVGRLRHVVLVGTRTGGFPERREESFRREPERVRAFQLMPRPGVEGVPQPGAGRPVGQSFQVGS